LGGRIDVSTVPTMEIQDLPGPLLPDGLAFQELHCPGTMKTWKEAKLRRVMEGRCVEGLQLDCVVVQPCC